MSTFLPRFPATFTQSSSSKEKSCPVCGFKLPEKGFCRTCEGRFHARTAPNKMLKSERVREVEFLVMTSIKHGFINLPRPYYEQRLSELLGREVDAITPNLIDEVKKQESYPGLPIANGWSVGPPKHISQPSISRSTTKSTPSSNASRSSTWNGLGFAPDKYENEEEEDIPF